jgi:hypothetical protein
MTEDDWTATDGVLDVLTVVLPALTMYGIAALGLFFTNGLCRGFQARAPLGGHRRGNAHTVRGQVGTVRERLIVAWNGGKTFDSYWTVIRARCLSPVAAPARASMLEEARAYERQVYGE